MVRFVRARLRAAVFVAFVTRCLKLRDFFLLFYCTHRTCSLLQLFGVLCYMLSHSVCSVPGSFCWLLSELFIDLLVCVPFLWSCTRSQMLDQPFRSSILDSALERELKEVRPQGED